MSQTRPDRQPPSAQLPFGPTAHRHALPEFSCFSLPVQTVGFSVSGSLEAIDGSRGLALSRYSIALSSHRERFCALSPPISPDFLWALR